MVEQKTSHLSESTVDSPPPVGVSMALAVHSTYVPKLFGAYSARGARPRGPAHLPYVVVIPACSWSFSETCSEKSVREHAHVQRGCGVGGNPVATGAARGLVGGRADRGPGAGTWTRGSRVFSVFSSRTSRLLARGAALAPARSSDGGRDATSNNSMSYYDVCYVCSYERDYARWRVSPTERSFTVQT